MASWWASSSSYIYNEEKRLNGLRAQRINFLVKNASDIPRAGKVLLDRLWLHGHGDIVVSKSGQLLEKTTFDGSVWQPCRFDFAAGAACSSTLTLQRGKPEVVLGAIDDT